MRPVQNIGVSEKSFTKLEVIYKNLKTQMQHGSNISDSIILSIVMLHRSYIKMRPLVRLPVWAPAGATAGA